MATLVHFDIPVENPERAKKFYRDLFGWKFNDLPGPMNYSLIETTDLNGQKAIGGGMSQRELSSLTGIVNYIGVNSLDESLKAIEKAGGKIIQPKQAVPGWGYLAVCLDTENNRIGLFQDNKKQR